VRTFGKGSDDARGKYAVSFRVTCRGCSDFTSTYDLQQVNSRNCGSEFLDISLFVDAAEHTKAHTSSGGALAFESPPVLFISKWEGTCGRESIGISPYPPKW
jgi:hypothetical protein